MRSSCKWSVDRFLMDHWRVQPRNAYHLYGKPGNSRENLNRTVHVGGNFPEKRQYLSRYNTFAVFPKRPRFSVPFDWITRARLHVQRKRKLYRYFVNGTTQSRSCFRCPKKYQYHLTEIFHRNFRANGKRSRSSVRDCLVRCAVYLFACYITSLIIHLIQIARKRTHKSS